MKLKTLKETIELCDICKKYPENNCHHPCCRNHKRIKQEAIKWVKVWQREKTTGRRQESGTYQYHRNMKINLFKDFFNITEDDLK